MDFFQDEYEQEKYLWTNICNLKLITYLYQIFKTYKEDYIIHSNLNFDLETQEITKNNNKKFIEELNEIFDINDTVKNIFKIIINDIKNNNKLDHKKVQIYLKLIKICSYRIKYNFRNLKFYFKL